MPSSSARFGTGVAAVLAAAILTASPSLAKDRSGTLTANDVLARARAAEGPAPNKTAVEEWEVAAVGLTGMQTVIRRGRDAAVLTHLGPFSTARGHVGNTVWHQDENGITVIDREQAERVTARALERVSEPVEAYVVLETFASGHVRRSYYDVRTFALLRRERWAGGHFSYTAWDDFRPEGGSRVQPWHYQGDDGDGNTFDYRLHSEREGAASDDAELVVPRNRRSTIEFPAGQRAARLPARFDRKRIYVRVAIGRHSYDFLLDSGASGIVLSTDAAKQLGLETYGSGSVTGAAELTSGRVIVPLLDVGALKMRDVVVRTAPLGDEERSERVSGLLGFDFIASAVLRIDYERGTLDAYENAGFVQPPGSTAVEVRLGEQIPMATVRVGESVGEDFLVDTGAGTSLLVFSHFATAHPADVSDDGVGAALASSGIGVAASGIGGRIGIRPVQVKRFRFGSTTFDDPLVYVAESPHALGRDTADGLVGADVLSRFTLYLDYAQSRIFLEPSTAR
jgi:predicted aspartyl protease